MKLSALLAFAERATPFATKAYDMTFALLESAERIGQRLDAPPAPALPKPRKAKKAAKAARAASSAARVLVPDAIIEPNGRLFPLPRK